MISLTEAVKYVKYGKAALLLPLALGASLAGCTAEHDDAPTTVTADEPATAVSEPERQAALQREAELGVRRAYRNDVEYTLELLAGMTTPRERKDGVNTWVYDGQQTFSDVRSPAKPGPWQVPPVIVGYTGDPDRYFGVGKAKMVDGYGRRWVLKSVDHALVQKMVAEYDDDVRRQFPGTPREAQRAAPTTFEYPEDAGQVYDLQPTSWDVTICAGDGASIWNHNNDDLNLMPAPANEVARKIVWLGSGSCSGSMVDTKWLLTAAHCVTDSNGNAVNPSTLKWCTMENLDENIQPGHTPNCYSVDSVAGIQVSPTWTGANDAVSDYAVLKLQTNGLSVGWIALTADSDGTVDNHTDYTKGYQRKNYNCTNNTVVKFVGGPTTHESYNGRQMFGASGDVQSTPSGYMKYNTSTALGISGGPHYYCPNGPCETGGHWMSGVQAYISTNTCSAGGTSCLGGFSSGPKASTIRAWVIAQTP
ncbi:MAG TPA: trypsin-like serine protease [Kofleriaceae bacterium]|nr:trypsin-like serine protease [Kofleriaceae bacterium]